MRKFACALAAAASLLSACSEKSDTDTAAAPQATAPAYEKIVFNIHIINIFILLLFNCSGNFAPY